MKVERLVFLASTFVATVAACSSSDSGPANQDAGGTGSGVGSGASSGMLGTDSGSSSGVQGTGSGSSSGMQGTTSGSSGAAPNSGSSGGDDGGGGGSMFIQCGAAPCGMPMACCRSASSDAATALTCVVACDFTTQVQLCANDNDCQAGPQFCVQGICADTPASGGSDGGAPEGGGSDGGGNDAGRLDAGRPRDAGRG